jgi:hypothetical protein
MISHEPKMPLPTELENHFILQIRALPLWKETIDARGGAN